MSKRDRPLAARLLRGGIVLAALVGGGLSAWIIDKAVRFPEIKASQFGHEAPLWIPSLLFVVGFTAAACLLFWRAARRVEGGEDLFDQRHRRRPSEGA